MSSKVKSTKGTPSGRKKDHSISDSTPSTSAVLLPQQQIVPEQSSVDEVLHGDDITALHIQQDQLSKLHPQPPPTHVEKKLKKVVVRKALHDKDASKQGHKSVAVLHPLPPHAPITEVRLLGSPHVGPRFDATSTFIAHSVLAPSESYAAALYQDEEMTRPPPIVLPEAQPTETKEVMTYQSTIPPKETHALEQWRRSMEDRRLQQSVISRKLLSSPQLLAMNQGDGFRNIQEERSAIERTIRPLETEKGYQVRSEFWQQQVSIGDDVTGIRSTLTQSEKGLPPELEFVGTPSFVQREKGLASTTGQCAPLYHAWRQSAYLAERRGHIQSTLQNMTVFNPDMQGLEVIGRSPWRKQRQRADSLDSSGDGEEEEEEEGTRNDSMFSSEREDERPASLPAVGPALRIGAHLVKWEGPPDTTLQQAQDPLEFRVLLEAGLDEMATSHLRLENCGTTAVYYSWQHMPKANPHGALRRDTQRFYFDTRGGVLLPGQSFPVPFIFKSPNAGVFSETWALQTGPVLARGKPLVFVLRGVAFQEDLHLEKRNAIEDMLARRMASDAAAAMIKRLVETVCTPPHTPPAMETFEMEEDLFISKNPGLFYHHNMVHKLKAMYDIIMSPVTPEGDTPPDSKGGKKVESKVLPAKDKGRKEGEGKKGKQPTIQEEPSREEGEDALGDTSELQGELSGDHTGWDLSIPSLQEAILHMEDDVLREERLKELNSIVGSLSFPPSEHPKARLYPIGYEVLCEAVDSLVAISGHMSQVMGVPLKEFSSTKSAEPEQVDSVPSSPVQSSKKDKKGVKEVKKPADTKQKGKEKEKVGPASSGKAKPVAPKKSKANIKDNDKPEGETEGPNMPAEVDPVVVKKYRDALHRMVYEILGLAVDKMAMMFEDVL